MEAEDLEPHSREQLDLFVVALKQVVTHSPGEFWTEALKLAGRVAQI